MVRCSSRATASAADGAPKAYAGVGARESTSARNTSRRRSATPARTTVNPLFRETVARRSFSSDASEARSSDAPPPPRASRNLRVRVTQRGGVYIASEAVIAKSRRNTSRRRVANASAVSRDWPLATARRETRAYDADVANAPSTNSLHDADVGSLMSSRDSSDTVFETASEEASEEVRRSGVVNPGQKSASQNRARRRSPTEARRTSFFFNDALFRVVSAAGDPPARVSSASAAAEQRSSGGNATCRRHGNAGASGASSDSPHSVREKRRTSAGSSFVESSDGSSSSSSSTEAATNGTMRARSRTQASTVGASAGATVAPSAGAPSFGASGSSAASARSKARSITARRFFGFFALASRRTSSEKTARTSAGLMGGWSPPPKMAPHASSARSDTSPSTMSFSTIPAKADAELPMATAVPVTVDAATRARKRRPPGVSNRHILERFAFFTDFMIISLFSSKATNAPRFSTSPPVCRPRRRGPARQRSRTAS